MKKSDKDRLAEIKELERKIKTEDISKEAAATKEWGGTDVIIAKSLSKELREWLGDQPHVISFQNTEPRRRLVITEHSRELSWLFYQLKDVFSDRADHVSKYDFYGLLAQTAVDCLERNKKSKDAKALLLEVLGAAKGLIDE